MFPVIVQQDHCTNHFFYKYIPLVLLLSQCFKNGGAIKCYVCDSSDNPTCADLKSNSSIVAEDCTLDKMKSIDTWLFELNKFAYFDTGANKNPLMNCQKVVANDPHTNKMVTARFCQLNTGDSDACAILETKLRSLQHKQQQQELQNANTNNNNNNNNNYYNDQQSKMAVEEDGQQFHCSICTTDNCNSTSTLIANIYFILFIQLFLMIKSIKQNIFFTN